MQTLDEMYRQQRACKIEQQHQLSFDNAATDECIELRKKIKDLVDAATAVIQSSGYRDGIDSRTERVVSTDSMRQLIGAIEKAQES